MTMLDDQGRATRRAVLMGCGATALVLAAAGAQARAGGGADDSELSIWRNRIGMRFRLNGCDGSMRVAAVEPTPTLGARPHGVQRRQNFLVMFEGSGCSVPAGDDIYRMSNVFTGSISLFLGKAADAGGSKRFVAAFN